MLWTPWENMPIFYLKAILLCKFPRFCSLGFFFSVCFVLLLLGFCAALKKEICVSNVDLHVDHTLFMLALS